MQGVGIALSIGAIATCGIAMADALRPKKAVAIEEYTLCYIMGTDTYKISSTGSIQLTAPTIQGYSFIGWRPDFMSDKVVYELGTCFEDINIPSNDATLNLYATYTSTINLDLQGGIDGDTSIECTKDIIMKDITNPTKEGYTFVGYFSEIEGQGVQYYNETGKGVRINDISNGTTLYAYWVAENN